MTPTADTPSVRPSVEIPASFTGTLRSLARRDLMVAWLAGFGRIAVLVVGLGIVRCLFDLWVQLDWIVRAVFLAIDVGIAGWLGYRYLWKPWKKRLDIRTAALRLERVFPVLDTRIIAAVQLPRQLERENISHDLVATVVRDAATTLAGLRWRDAVPARPALRWLGLAAGIALLGGILAALQPDHAAILARRWLLSHEAPVTLTKLVLAQQDMQVARGTLVRLGATASGSIPNQAVFEVKPATGDSRTFPIESAENEPGAFTLKIDNVQQSFRYRVRAGDARSAWHDITTLPSPALLEPRFTIQPPAYTGMPAARAPEGESLVIPAGSTLRIEGRSSLPLTSANVALWSELRTAQPAAVTTTALKLRADSTSFSGEIVINSPISALTVPLTATNGIASQTDTRLPVRFMPDAAPVITYTAAPADADLATVNTLLPVRGRASDDYGVTRLALCWEIVHKDTATPPTTGRLDLALPANPGPRANFDASVSTGTAPADTANAISLNAAPGDVVTWWIEAVDNAPAPSTSTSPRRTVRIVTPDEKVGEMMGRLREGMGQLEEVSRRQEQIGNALGRLLPTTPENSQPAPK